MVNKMRQVLLSILSSICALSIWAQSADNTHYLDHATIERTSNNSISIVANSPRPLQQATTALRRYYGWTIDYEEPQYDQSQTRIVGNTQRLIGGKFQALIPEVEDNSPDSEKSALEAFLQEFNQKSTNKFNLVQNLDTRYDIVPDVTGDSAILDTPIKIDPSEHSISEEISSILTEVSRIRGVQIIRGGLIDNELDSLRVSISHKNPMPARQLLAEALDHASSRKLWILTYEPNDRTFYIGIETAVKASKAPSGEVQFTPIPAIQH
jgi:hypothetical protein